MIMCFPSNFKKCRSLNSNLSLMDIDQYLDSTEVLPILEGVQKLLSTCTKLGKKCLLEIITVPFLCEQDN